MAKAPADQFYWGDWLNDPELQACSSSTRGVWANALGRMWFATQRGELKGTKEELMRLCNANQQEWEMFISDRQKHDFCDVITQMITEKNVIKNGICNNLITADETVLITLRNRRMYKKAKDIQNTYIRLKRYRKKKHDNADDNGTCNANETDASSSSYNKEYKESENETLEKPENKNHHPPYQEFRKLWLTLLPNTIQPHVKNDTWHPDFRARWNEDDKRQDLIYWQDLIEQLIKPSRFLMGGVDPPEGRKRFIVSLPWILKRKNFYKLIQGEYK